MTALPIILMLYALVDCVVDEDVERTSVPKMLWVVMIVILPFAGALAWLIVAKIAKPRPNRRSRRSRPAGPTGPDDDPEFLRRLAEEQRRKNRKPDAEPSDGS